MLIVNYDPRVASKPWAAFKANRRNALRTTNTLQREHITNGWLVWCANCGTDKCVCHTTPLSVIRDHPDNKEHVRMLYDWPATTSWGVRGRNQISYLHGYMQMFYGALACDMVTRGQYRATVTEPLINELANTLARAVVMSCLGEARYHAANTQHMTLIGMQNAKGKTPKPENWESVAYTHTRVSSWLERAQLGAKGIVRGTRQQAVAGVGGAHVGGFGTVVSDDEVVAAANIAKTVHGIHLSTVGALVSEGIGGPLWYQGAKLVFDYLHGRIPAALFIDQTFDLVHNGGTLTNKVIKTHVMLQRNILDWRREASLEEMIAFCPPELKAKYRLKTHVAKDTSSWLPLEIIQRAGVIGFRNNTESDALPRELLNETIEHGMLTNWWLSLKDEEIIELDKDTWEQNVPPKYRGLPNSIIYRVPVVGVILKDEAINHMEIPGTLYQLQDEDEYVPRYAVKLPPKIAVVLTAPYTWTQQDVERKDPTFDLVTDVTDPVQLLGLDDLRSQIWKQHNGRQLKLTVHSVGLAQLPDEVRQKLKDKLGITLIAHDPCVLCKSVNLGTNSSALGNVYSHLTMRLLTHYTEVVRAKDATYQAALKAYDDYRRDTPAEQFNYMKLEQLEIAITTASEKFVTTKMARALFSALKLPLATCIENDPNCVCRLAVESCCEAGYVLHNAHDIPGGRHKGCTTERRQELAKARRQIHVAVQKAKPQSTNPFTVEVPTEELTAFNTFLKKNKTAKRPKVMPGTAQVPRIMIGTDREQKMKKYYYGASNEYYYMDVEEVNEQADASNAATVTTQDSYNYTVKSGNNDDFVAKAAKKTFNDYITVDKLALSQLSATKSVPVVDPPVADVADTAYPWHVLPDGKSFYKSANHSFTLTVPSEWKDNGEPAEPEEAAS